MFTNRKMLIRNFLSNHIPILKKCPGQYLKGKSLIQKRRKLRIQPPKRFHKLLLIKQYICARGKKLAATTSHKMKQNFLTSSFRFNKNSRRPTDHRKEREALTWPPRKNSSTPAYSLKKKRKRRNLSSSKQLNLHQPISPLGQIVRGISSI